MQNKRLLTAEQVAEMLGIGVYEVWKLGREGRLPRIVLGHRTVRFDPDDVDAYINGKREPRYDRPQEIPY